MRLTLDFVNLAPPAGDVVHARTITKLPLSCAFLMWTFEIYCTNVSRVLSLRGVLHRWMILLLLFDQLG